MKKLSGKEISELSYERIECLLIEALKANDYTRFKSLLNDLYKWEMEKIIVRLLINFERDDTIGKAIFNALKSLHPLI